MADVVGCINLSHSPIWGIAPPAGPTEPGGHFITAVNGLCELAESLSLDAVVVIGTDHARGLFYDLMPPFTIGVARAQGVGDYDTFSGELAVHTELATAVFDGVTARGFDPAVSLDLRIDHGLAQVYGKLFPALEVPLVPVILNSGCPPLPTFARSWMFGEAIGQALRQSPVSARVLMVGSGGMSHWPNPTSVFDTSISDEWRDFLIHGRSRVAELEPWRRAKALSIVADKNAGKVNAAWDTDMLVRIKNDTTVLRELDSEDVEELAGNGAHELRTWAAATAAWGGPLTYVDYEPVAEWITGMGAAASHDPGALISALRAKDVPRVPTRSRGKQASTPMDRITGAR